MEGNTPYTTERKMAARAKELLEEFTSITKIPIVHHPDADAVLDSDPWTFVLEFKAQSSIASIEAAISNLRRVSERFRQVGKELVPIVVVPYMTDVGAKRCEEAGCSWLDLSGNAVIRGPGLRINLRGAPNKFKRRGRPRSAFAPKSARVARALLLAEGHTYHQQELVEVTGLSKGHVSRVLKSLLGDGLVERDPSDHYRVSVPRPGLLLDAWAEEYDFQKHTIHKGHVPARNSSEAIEQIHGQLANLEIRHALTGLAGAWLLDPFANFRIVTVYVERMPLEAGLAEIGFRPLEEGSNTWLVVPDDEGVFDGTTEPRGYPCVSPVQVYLDLLAHPERADEAAEHLREALLWT